LRAFVAHQEFGEDPARIGWPALLLEDQPAVGGVDDLIVDLRDGFGLQQQRFGLGTPDLAAASKLVADEHQRRTSGLGRRDTRQGRCSGRRQAPRHHGPSVEHAKTLLVDESATR